MHGKSVARRLRRAGHITDRTAAAKSPFVVSIDWERLYQGRRYYWTICGVQNPDELVSWGHAPTRELAEMAAGNAVSNLMSS
jgi:hypothetical protein